MKTGRETIGFVGLGTIGAPMALRLIEAGHAVVAFDLRSEALEPIADRGARACASIGELAALCSLVFTSLPGPDEVRDVVRSGLLEGLAPGSLVVDLSTNSPDTVRQLHAELAARYIDFVDAPVSGGAMGAERGTLTVMASGSEPAFERARPYLEAFSSAHFYLGAPGNGTLVKLINNAIFLCSGLVLQECFVLGAKAGLDIEELLDVVKQSSGAAYAGLAGLFFGRHFDSPIFKLAIARKDVMLAVEAAEKIGVPMDVTSAAAALYARAEDSGLGEKVFFATLAAIEQAAGTQVPELKSD